MWFSTKKVFESAERLGSGIINGKLITPYTYEDKTYNFVGFYSLNTVRYLTADIACGLYSFTIVPLYDTLGEEAME